jgi:hypothetical protein
MFGREAAALIANINAVQVFAAPLLVVEVATAALNSAEL